jgi:hypothetical protein
MKKCNQCNKELELEMFYKSIKENDGLQHKCKNCNKLNTINFRLSNPNYFKEANKKFHNSNPSYNKKWYKDNNNKHKENTKFYTKKRMKVDYIFKLQSSTRILIGNSFKNCLKGTYKKGKKTESILGCTLEEFINHLQSKFTEGMTLENHGEWEIDHIIPISSSKTEEEIYKLNHYTNFQPLWKKDNRSKGAKFV